MLYINIGVASIRQIQCEQIEYVTEKNKDNYSRMYAFSI